MRRSLFTLALLTIGATLAVGQPGAPSPLVVDVTTGRASYRLRRPVHITLTETNTSDQDVPVSVGCQILHAYAHAEDGTVVWVFRDFRLCLTARGILPAGASRTFDLTWDTTSHERGVRVRPGRYTITAGVDGVSDSTDVRLRRRR